MKPLPALVGLVLLVALLAMPHFVYPVFLMKVLCFALFACAFNLLIGYVGLLSFGHAAYFGGGAYIAAHMIKVGTVYVQMIFFFCLQAPFTGGEDGIQAVPRGRLLGVVDLDSNLAMYGFVATVCFAAFLLIHRIVHSPFGQVLKAIRENEPRAVSLGYRADHYKLIAFVLSAGISGLAGAMKALVFQLASLTDVHWSMSGEAVLMTLVGGLGTIFGPMFGAFIIVAMQNYLAQLGAWVTVVQGVIFVVCVMAFRRGIVGEIARRLRRPL